VQAEVERLRAQVVHMSNEAEQLRRSGPPQMVADLAHANSEAAHLRSTMSVLASDVQRAQARVLTLETEYRCVCVIWMRSVTSEIGSMGHMHRAPAVLMSTSIVATLMLLCQ
jgi:hypothetical protein